MKNKNRLFWLLNSTGWLVLLLIYILLYNYQNLTNLNIIFRLSIIYFCGFLISIPLRYFYRKIDYQSRSILSLAIIVIFTTIITAGIWVWLSLLFRYPFPDLRVPLSQITIYVYITRTYSHLWVLVLWSGLYFGIKIWAAWLLQRERTERANALAQAAQLKMLRYQLNPHFLFNALNSIRALIEEDKNQARRMITELSEFLRYSLISKNYANVPLINEIEAIRHYFTIQKIRYEEKLEVTIEIDPPAEDFPVLSFLIHPLIENAIKYGMQTSSMPLKIRVTAEVQNDTLKIDICNTGSWIPPAEKQQNRKNGTGTGIKNVQQRLENAFPQAHNFKIDEAAGWVCIRLEIKKDVTIQLS